MTSGGRATDLYRAFASPPFSAPALAAGGRGTRDINGENADGVSFSGRNNGAADERERMDGNRPLLAATAAGAAPRAAGTSAPPRARGRDPVIDGLRGLMVLVMAIDHFGGPLTRFTF